jgi:hypothetical protein
MVPINVKLLPQKVCSKQIDARTSRQIINWRRTASLSGRVRLPGFPVFYEQAFGRSANVLVEDIFDRRSLIGVLVGAIFLTIAVLSQPRCAEEEISWTETATLAEHDACRGGGRGSLKERSLR